MQSAPHSDFSRTLNLDVFEVAAKGLAGTSCTYPLLSTGCEPIISGAMGSLYIAKVPSTVTDTFIPKDRGTARGDKKKPQQHKLTKKQCKFYELNIAK